MSVDISSMSPRVRDVFMLAEAAILEWDVKAHSKLDDCLRHDKRIRVDADPDRVFGEKFAAVVTIVIVNAIPSYILWGVIEAEPLHWDFPAFVAGFVVVSTAGIALYYGRRIQALRGAGAVWKRKVNRLIDAAKRLNRAELRELYAAMYAAGLDIRQAKLNAAIAYRQGFEDGFVLGGDDFCHHR